MNVELTIHLFSTFHCERVLKIEHSQLPVCVSSFGTSRKACSFVASRKLDIEKTNKCMDVIITTRSNSKWHFEVEFVNLHSLQIDFFHHTGICHNLPGIND